MLTEKELAIITTLSNAYNEYVKLEKQRPYDTEDFANAIREAQKIIMIRDARRNHPDAFLKYPYDTKTEEHVEVKNHVFTI